ncbi:ABC transporter ATP-binding protein [Propylenella binzhouense]|uniref:ABC transporter ATP-binding protein n=1 Tax=Propylenella binzhouense TaxID=2555902 RepID=A0A964T6V3_9HYPH|nr:ABC transporter ATP-binding protein [Propylenella binzhouense]MYZ49195.1 ABC transporter ATP-binding protein [Propylenella binzhouense]
MHGGTAPPILRVSGVTAGYGDIQVLWGVDLAVPAGEIVSIVGPNGAGKTTLLLAISGMVRARGGSIHFEGEDITGASPDRIVRKRLIHVPEGRRLFPTLSVRDNLLLGAYAREDGAEEIARDLELVYSIFPILKERSEQGATTMSGGEQQMCAIGRGIMARPKLLLIDELSLGLSPKALEVLAESLLKINREGISILLVEQDVMTAFELASTAYVLESGKVRMSGRTETLIEDAAVRAAYLGH